MPAFRHRHARAMAGRDARAAYATGARANYEQIKIMTHCRLCILSGPERRQGQASLRPSRRAMGRGQ
ncbi:hypothetical protein SXCC_03216 [Gluconacetobacter sp. SXCC-1]|nr:hypothetical protein SXCC_03216 [Gluconacetobacter sp. SXCC-1]